MPQLKILHLKDSLYFGFVSYVAEFFKRYREQKHLFLLTKNINQVDVPSAELLLNESLERRKMGYDLYLYRLKDSTAKVLNKGGYIEELMTENIFDSKDESISAFLKTLLKYLCQLHETYFPWVHHLAGGAQHTDLSRVDQTLDGSVAEHVALTRLQGNNVVFTIINMTVVNCYCI
jgi:hypothetical protein